MGFLNEIKKAILGLKSSEQQENTNSDYQAAWNDTYTQQALSAQNTNHYSPLLRDQELSLVNIYMNYESRGLDTETKAHFDHYIASSIPPVSGPDGDWGNASSRKIVNAEFHYIAQTKDVEGKMIKGGHWRPENVNELTMKHYSDKVIPKAHQSLGNITRALENPQTVSRLKKDLGWENE